MKELLPRPDVAFESTDPSGFGESGVRARLGNNKQNRPANVGLTDRQQRGAYKAHPRSEVERY